LNIRNKHICFISPEFQNVSVFTQSKRKIASSAEGINFFKRSLHQKWQEPDLLLGQYLFIISIFLNHTLVKLGSILVMSDMITLFHNPKCSKSRATLQLLQEKGIEPLIVEYLATPPTADEIEYILEKLGKEPRDIMRKKEQPYIDNNLNNENLERSELITAIVENPILMERPIVLANDKAALGRPPELVLEIL
jgi:arsenate reductase (glutaredoxin)